MGAEDGGAVMPDLYGDFLAPFRRLTAILRDKGWVLSSRPKWWTKDLLLAIDANNQHPPCRSLGSRAYLGFVLWNVMLARALAIAISV